jgi:hypothetical protein
MRQRDRGQTGLETERQTERQETDRAGDRETGDRQGTDRVGDRETGDRQGWRQRDRQRDRGQTGLETERQTERQGTDRAGDRETETVRQKQTIKLAFLQQERDLYLGKDSSLVDYRVQRRRRHDLLTSPRPQDSARMSI